MSKKYPGGIIRGTPVVPAGPFQDSAAPGIWTLEQATNYIRQGIWPTAGNINPDLFIENLFSTWLYTGTGSTQTITNGIDLAGRGGLVWIKSRSAATDHELTDTVRLARNFISSNTTAAQSAAGGIANFSSTGFDVLGAFPARVNTNAATYVSWTFREQPRFFDIVTYTGNGANRTIAHSLGSVPGCIIVKRLNATATWAVWHRELFGNNSYLVLNTTAGSVSDATYWNSTRPTADVFSLGTNANVNANGGTYVAYLFAHNAGGFGATGADNVISCGDFILDSGGNGTVTLGYEPQWILAKSKSASSWYICDVTRGMSVASSGNNQQLYANLADAELTTGGLFPTSTGFASTGGFPGGAEFIYIAIRRGPMRTPTSGTSVFAPVAYSGNSSGSRYISDYGFPLDLLWYKRRNGGDFSAFGARLTGGSPQLVTSSADAETIISNIQLDQMLGFFTTSTFQNALNESGATIASGGFRRAPGFFDVVCYTGTGAASQTLNHNLGVSPELIIQKARSTTSTWPVYRPGILGSLRLNTTAAIDINPIQSATATTFNTNVGTNGVTYVSYLFASCPGVSKVGSYTGTGATQTINCGFAAGARFVLIKRTDSTGDWYVWDSARGIVAGNDPYITLNTSNPEVTNTDWVDTAASGFELSNAAGNLVNTNGGSYIFLAIA